MLQEIRIINLSGVNCCLIKTSDGYILIDTGFFSKRTKLEQELEAAGCRPSCQLIDDLADFNNSIEKLRRLGVKTVYPGHGKPFALAQYPKRGS